MAKNSIKFRNIKVKANKMLNFPSEKFKEMMFTLSDGQYEFIFRKQKVKRSLPQNDFYWTVYVTPLADYLGYQPEELHGHFKILILRKRFKKQGYTSTTELSKSEFSEYLEYIEHWAWNEFQFTFEIAESSPHQNRLVL